ncbi:MAG: SPASM domain-containing protein [Burkholderiales bacterium]|nr:SPASM domain-containing protein [Phycisphaerae bacterium]
MKTIALLSMLHEAPAANSGTRRFRGEAVLAWTLRRLARSTRLNGVFVSAWLDQRGGLHNVLADSDIHDCGTRRPIQQLDAITAAQRWSDGWRGGLLATCAFDRGYVGEIVLELMTRSDADAIVLIDPAAALVDSQIIDRLIQTAADGQRDYYFTQAPPGLGGVLLKRAMAERLATGRTHPGKVVHYLPDAPVLDPVTSDACVAMPLEISRSLDQFLLDSERQINRITAATEPLNGTLISTEANAIAMRVATVQRRSKFPREIVIELTARRLTRPVFNPISHLSIDRADLSLESLDRVLAQATRYDDVRITLAGIGDPLLHPQLPDVLSRLQGLHAVSLETDLLETSKETLDALVRANIDVISVHVPAMTPATYAAMMGADRLMEAVENIKRLLWARQQRGQGTPIIAPTFVKATANLDEMEQWYDTWLSAIGSAVITGPGTFAAQVPDCSAADMSPPVRRACQRIESRLTILSDGKIVMCEQDVLGINALGHVLTQDLEDVWNQGMQPLRTAHAGGQPLPVLCTACRDWYRP